MIPPTTPLSTDSRRSWPSGRYGASEAASKGSGMDCSQTVPGPDSTAKWCSSPPNYLLATPGTRTTWNDIAAWNMPTCPGWIRSDWPGASW